MDPSTNRRPVDPYRRILAGEAALLVFLLVAPQAACANENEYALGPQRSEVAKFGEAAFVEPDVIEAENGTLDTELTVVLVDERGDLVVCAPDVSTSRGDRYYRAYMAKGQRKPKPTGPTLKFAPGDTVRVLLKNRMCKGDDEASSAGFEGNPPQVAIDRNEQHGINHTNLHTHGLWVSPAGNSDNVLIAVAPGSDFQFEYLIPEDHVPGTHWYHPHKHGSVKTQVETGMSGAIIMTGGLDDEPAIKRATERVMVIQKFLASKAPKAGAPAPVTADSLRFPEDQVTTINGVRGPTIKGVAPGQTERWRIVSAMASAQLNIWVETHRGSENLCAGVKAETPDTLLRPIAYDGIPVAKVEEWDRIRLFPGNRVDLMLRFDAPGNYVICNDSSSSDTGPIGYVQVDRPPVDPMPIPERFDDRLRHASLLDDKAVEKDRRRVLFSQSSDPFRVFIDNKRFDPNRVDQRVPLGAKEEWHLLNDSPGEQRFHPFHIHVNPFQIVDSNDEIYQRMKGVWLDTVGIPGSAGQGPGRAPGYVTIRSHFKKYIGLYVLHCHILGHEDAGMMQIVEVY